MPLTLFSFGYSGWGGAKLPHLLEAVDRFEATQGFLPPLWVDIRFSRRVRAQGFSGSNSSNGAPPLADLVGEGRYLWLQDLGNVLYRQRPQVQLSNPDALGWLLAGALAASAERRRLIFFCACKELSQCHRRAVKEGLELLAHEHAISISVQELLDAVPV